MMLTPSVFLMFTFPPSTTVFSLSALTEDRKVLQAKSSDFFLSTPLKMVPKRKTAANTSAFLAHNFTPYCGYSVKTALKYSVTKTTAANHFMVCLLKISNQVLVVIHKM